MSEAGRESKPCRIGWYAGIVVIVLWIGFAVVPRLVLGQWDNAGVFGDTFGGANALFAGLAFAVLIHTLHLQKEELALQRQELELTRQELARSADAQEASQKALKDQVEQMGRTTIVQILATQITAIEEDIARKSAGSDVAKRLLTRRDLLRDQLKRMIGELSTLLPATAAFDEGEDYT